MSEYPQTLLQIVQHALNRHPELAEHVEKAAALAQGKGFGTATIALEVKCVQMLLKRPPVLAMDVGGNIGDYTAELRAKFPQLEIHTFEPSSLNYGRLTARYAADPRVTLVNKALSDKAGAATLFTNVPGSGGASLTRRKLDHLNIKFDREEAITSVVFEDYWNQTLGRREIDFVKLDIEGHELNALKGFGEALRSIRLIQFEFGGCNIDTRTYFQDFWYFFKDAGFDLYRITPTGMTHLPGYKESDEFFSTTNFMAANPRLL